jgi:hypothetical protein
LYTDASFPGDTNLLHFTALKTDAVPYASRFASSYHTIPNLLLILFFLLLHLAIHIRYFVNNIHMEKAWTTG